LLAIARTTPTFNSTLAIHLARCFGMFLDGWTLNHFHIGISA
jgi:hypothetical protein